MIIVLTKFVTILKKVQAVPCEKPPKAVTVLAIRIYRAEQLHENSVFFNLMIMAS